MKELSTDKGLKCFYQIKIVLLFVKNINIRRLDQDKQTNFRFMKGLISCKLANPMKYLLISGQNVFSIDWQLMVRFLFILFIYLVRTQT